jgi:[ribosomal protein S18]-alanine N-acetyltransferase
LCVAKAHRRSRIAEKLLENVIEAAPCAEKHIWLEVRKSNSAAVSFYRSMNFVERGIRKNFYRAPTEDALIMELLPKRELPNKAA